MKSIFIQDKNTENKETTNIEKKGVDAHTPTYEKK
jgi:hypothetical protein